MKLTEITTQLRNQVDDLYDMTSQPTHDMSTCFLKINETIDILERYTAKVQVYLEMDYLSDYLEKEVEEDIEREKKQTHKFYLNQEDMDPFDEEKVKNIYAIVRGLVK